MPIEYCTIHSTVKIWHPELVNLYGCDIEANCKIGTFVEIGPNVKIGEGCKIESFVFIPEGVTIGNNVFIGPGTIFCNTKHPMRGEKYKKTEIKDNVVIGANATILPGITLWPWAIIGAGAIVTDDVQSGQTVICESAKLLIHHRIKEFIL